MRSPRRSHHSADDGNAIIEFTWLAVLLLVPLVYLMLAVFDVQRSAYGITEATREAGRAFARADSVDDAYAKALAAARISLADQGLTLDPADLVVVCTPDPCTLAPGSRVHVEIDLDVGLPMLPRMFGHGPVPVSASYDEVVDTYRADGG